MTLRIDSQDTLIHASVAAEILGTDAKGLLYYVRAKRIKWTGPKTRTFHRLQVERLKAEIEKEILGDDGTQVGPGQPALGSVNRQWKGADLA